MARDRLLLIYPIVFIVYLHSKSKPFIMRMIALFICTITLSLTACVNMLEDGILDNQRRANKVLSISVLTEPATKDLIVSTYLPSTSQVGVFLTDGSDGDYDGHSYNNICYEAVGSDADQTWTSSTSIPLDRKSTRLNSSHRT